MPDQTEPCEFPLGLWMPPKNSRNQPLDPRSRLVCAKCRAVVRREHDTDMAEPRLAGQVEIIEPHEHAGEKPGGSVEIWLYYKLPPSRELLREKLHHNLPGTKSSLPNLYADYNAPRIKACIDFCRGVSLKDLEKGNLGVFVEAKWDSNQRLITDRMAEAVAILKGKTPSTVTPTEKETV